MNSLVLKIYYVTGMTTLDDFSNYFKGIDGMEYPVSLNLEARKK